MDFQGFCGQFYTEQSISFDAQRCINLYPVESGGASKSPMALFGDAGLTEWLGISSSPTRGVYSFGTYLFTVMGGHLIQVRSDKTTTIVGELATTNGPVTMIHNNNSQLAVVDGLNLYIYDINTAVFTTITTANGLLGNPNSITFMDQYFVVSLTNTSGIYGDQAFQISAINDGLTWSAIQYNLAASDPDVLVAVGVAHRLLYLFGDYTTEIWYDAGTSPFPFQFTASVIEYGIVSAKAFTALHDTIAWCAKSRFGEIKAIVSTGYDSVPISTPALEQRWATYQRVTDVEVFASGYGGRDFLYFNFPSAPNGGETFVFDLKTKMWHERQSYGVGMFRANCHTNFGGFDLFGDSQIGTIMQMDNTVYTEMNNPIVRIRRAPHVQGEHAGQRPMIFYSSFQADFEPGVGTGAQTDSGDGSLAGVDPKARLRWSDNGGFTWSNYYTKSLGPLGNYKTRTIWRRLGGARDRVFELSISDPVKVAITGVTIGVTPGYG